MKFALIDGHRREAQPGLSGECPGCGGAMLAKCGNIRVWHWAHRSRRRCDHWWENETEWHRNWKNQFPVEWQEVVQKAEDGEKHIADVKTDQGWVIEFQHSHLGPGERRSREAYYGNLVWVVDGLRRKYDLKQFIEAVSCGIQISQKPLVAKVHPLDCRLVDEWSTSRVPVFFDFGERIQPHGLWLLIPIGQNHTAYLTLVDKHHFSGWHRKGDFSPKPFIDLMKTYEQERVRALKAQYASPRMPQWMPRRSRRRFWTVLRRKGTMSAFAEKRT